MGRAVRVSHAPVAASRVLSIAALTARAHHPLKVIYKDAHARTAPCDSSLFVLGDDALRCALTFLTPSVCALGPGATSKAMREVATSRQLEVARKSGSYVLRPPDNGVVHALATAMGTQQWATRSVRRHQLNREGSAGFANAAAVPPSRLRIIAYRQSNHATTENHEDDEEPYASFFASLIVDQSQSVRCDGGRECALGAGSYIGYELPFLLRLSHFRLAIGRCGYATLCDWSFEAFDSEQEEWQQLFSCDRSPWADIPYTNYVPRALTFPVDYAGLPFPATRFRIMLERRRCMHIRGLEIFGTLLPGWSLD